MTESFSNIDQPDDGGTDVLIDDGGLAGVEGGAEPDTGPFGSALDDLSVYPLSSDVTLVDSDYNDAWDHALVDIDGDGVADVLAAVQGDKLMLAVDTDGSGQFSESRLVTFDELRAYDPLLADALEANLEVLPPADAEYTFTTVDATVAAEESPYWFEQAVNGFCVPASVAQIIGEYSGVVFEDEMAFVDLANEYGLFVVGEDGVPGMTMESTLFLMEQAGVPASMVVGSDIGALDGYLEAGHGVVLYVDADVYWYGEEGDAGNHAVVIQDIDHEAGVAVLTDPGHPDGNGWTVSLTDLEEAWAAGDNTMIVAEEPAPTADVEQAASTVDVTQTDVTQTDVTQTDVTQTDVTSAGAAAVTNPGTSPLLGGEPVPAVDPLYSVLRNPWVLLPITLAASAVVARSSR